HPPYKTVRKLHPTLQHISAYMSALGAGVALGDLDGDGFSNDVGYVDPRTEQTICAPVPGTPERYSPFALEPGPTFGVSDSVAQQGCLIADLNEDGRMDVLVFYWG